MRARRATAGTALTVATLLAAASLIAGCGGAGGGGQNDSASGGSMAAGPEAASEDKAAGDLAGQGTEGQSQADGERSSARVVPITRSVVYRGEISLRVKNVATAVARAEGFATGVDGVVFNEQTTTDPGRHGATRATMTLKVPTTQFRPVLNQLGGLGRQLSRSQTAEDVTSQAVDIESRLTSQRRSVARLQTLMGKATTVGAIVQVESELSQREADLEALEAQQKKLGDLVDLATINVSFGTPDAHTGPAPDESDLGFLSGLRGGWDALVGVLLVGLTVAGAALPFLVALALLGVPAWLVVRSRRHPSVGPVASDG